MHGSRRRARMILAALGVTAFAGEAQAYCRLTTGCGDASSVTGDNCFEPVDACSSQPLFWREGCVGFSVDEHGSKLRGITPEQTFTAAQAAFDKWLGPVCDGERPGITVQFLTESDCQTFEYNEQGTWYGNSNSIFFVDGASMPKCGKTSGSGDTIGDTCGAHDKSTGEMYDADIALDSHNFTLMAPDSDLNSVLLHEAGHFLGLGHVTDPNDIMFWQYTGQLTLSDDDKRAICDIYPPHRETRGVCSFLPRHGFSAECASSQEQLRCSGSASGSGSGAGALVVMVVGLALGCGRRRDRARPRRAPRAGEYSRA